MLWPKSKLLIYKFLCFYFKFFRQVHFGGNSVKWEGDKILLIWFLSLSLSCFISQCNIVIFYTLSPAIYKLCNTYKTYPCSSMLYPKQILRCTKEANRKPSEMLSSKQRGAIIQAALIHSAELSDCLQWSRCSLSTRNTAVNKTPPKIHVLVEFTFWRGNGWMGLKVVINKR